jgi:putative protein kinase ArgK-like GTPase of G3E family
LLASRRAHRLLEELREIIVRRLEREARDLVDAGGHKAIVERVQAREVDPYEAAEQIVASLGP